MASWYYQKLYFIRLFLWAIFVSDEARHHPFISEAEKTFILENHAKQEKKRDDSKVRKGPETFHPRSGVTALIAFQGDTRNRWLRAWERT